MTPAFHLLYHPKVKTDDIPRLSPDVALRVRKSIEERLAFDPEKFGFPLRKGLRGYRKLRLGDYRVIYRIEQKTLKILMIGHRKDVYEKAPKRFFTGD